MKKSIKFRKLAGPVAPGSTPVAAETPATEPQRTITMPISDRTIAALSLGLGESPRDEDIARRVNELFAYFQGALVAGLHFVKAMGLDANEVAFANWIGDQGNRGVDAEDALATIERIAASAKERGIEFPDVITTDPARAAMLVNSGMPLWLASVFIARCHQESEEKRIRAATPVVDALTMTLPTPPYSEGGGDDPQ